MFLQRFPVIMENQISVDWDTIMGAYDRAPLFPITLIDNEVLDYWCAHPTVGGGTQLATFQVGADHSAPHPT